MASHLFPFGFNQHWRRLVCHLPPYERAIDLVEKYHRMVDSQVVAVPPSQTDDDIFPQFYPGKELIQAESLSETDLHDLGLLFALLAIGCANDDSPSHLNAEAESYAHLSRAALSSRDLFENASLSAVQAILALCVYTMSKSSGMSGRNDMIGNLMGFACQIAMSVRAKLYVR